ncbi:hypothetical protein ACI797_05610 [Geodermatophilus sp. SYSU D00691]
MDTRTTAQPPAAFSPDRPPVPPEALRPAAPAARPSREGYWRQIPPDRAGALAVAALAVGGATAVGLRWATRPARIGPITMGPGGWVSVKGAKPPADPGDRPLWARLLRSYRL